MGFIRGELDRPRGPRNWLGSGFARAKPLFGKNSVMDDDTAIFPLPAGATPGQQADALARAAWFMGGPDDSPVHQDIRANGGLNGILSEPAKDSSAGAPWEGTPERSLLRDSAPVPPAQLRPPPPIPDR
jgi:hypothetical protein